MNLQFILRNQRVLKLYNTRAVETFTGESQCQHFKEMGRICVARLSTLRKIIMEFIISLKNDKAGVLGDPVSNTIQDKFST